MSVCEHGERGLSSCSKDRRPLIALRARRTPPLSQPWKARKELRYSEATNEGANKDLQDEMDVRSEKSFATTSRLIKEQTSYFDKPTFATLCFATSPKMTRSFAFSLSLYFPFMVGLSHEERVFTNQPTKYA